MLTKGTFLVLGFPQLTIEHDPEAIHPNGAPSHPSSPTLMPPPPAPSHRGRERTKLSPLRGKHSPSPLRNITSNSLGEQVSSSNLLRDTLTSNSLEERKTLSSFHRDKTKRFRKSDEGYMSGTERERGREREGREGQCDHRGGSKERSSSLSRLQEE